MKPIAVVVACTLTFAACAGMWSAHNLTPSQRMSEKLRDRIDHYMKLRSEAVDAVGGLRSTQDQPADLLIDYMRNALPPRAATQSPP